MQCDYPRFLLCLITDNAFSRILWLCDEAHGALIVVNEAHAMGQCGKEGVGVGERGGIQDKIDIRYHLRDSGQSLGDMRPECRGAWEEAETFHGVNLIECTKKF